MQVRDLIQALERQREAPDAEAPQDRRHRGWDITWSYRCSDPLFGDFKVNVHPDRTYAILDTDGRGSGVEHFDAGGTNFLEVKPGDGCSWTLKVSD